ncbi:sugar porter family MFS transporter [Sciscionella marina]|uniref:sugar porter family MFS transporter n=1 Tax=Sciscionella marina TaxID=508770 RepID=UPI0003752AFD|nr:sugar porter family MFS transporter [Sciscionella marina]
MTDGSVQTKPGVRGAGGFAVAAASVIAALGGLLFGYDTGVISGALLYLTPAFHLTGTMQQIVVSSLLVGAVVGVVIGGPIADRAGRKRTLIGVTIVFTLAALASAMAPDIPVMLVSRFVLGIAIGTSSLTVPTYIAEIARSHVRGRLVSLHQFMVTVGILVSYLIGYAYEDSADWRMMLGLAIAPAVIMFAGLLTLPESPRWFIAHGRHDEAKAVLSRIRRLDEVDAEFDDILNVVHTERRVTYRELLKKGSRRWIAVGIAAAGTSQVVGVNAVIYYAPTILKNAGFGNSAAVLASVGIGSLNVLFTILALVFIDKLGRRPLILGGGCAVIIALVVIGVLFLFPLQGAVATWTVIVLALYQASFACSLGIAIWLVNSEIFPTTVRGKASSFGIVTHWGLDLAVSISVLTLITALSASGVFWLYAVLGTLGVAYLFRRLPETKNRTLEDIERDLHSARPEPSASSPTGR